MKITIKQLKAMIKEQIEEMPRQLMDTEESLEGKFVLSIQLGNSEMSNKYQIAKALSRLEAELRTGNQVDPFGNIRDENGNKVGSWRID